MKRFLLIAALTFASFAAHAQAATCVTGTAGIAPTAKLNFVAPTTNTDGTAIAAPVTYNLYQSNASGTETKVASTLAGSPVSVTVGLTPNSTAYFKISSVDKNGIESALSNEVCKSFPASVPGTVTITIS